LTIGLIANNDGTGALQLGGSNAISLDTSLNATMAGYVNAPNTFGFKNRLINGGMVIDQRNNGAAVTIDSGERFIVDRWATAEIGNGVLTGQRITDAPSGFSFSQRVTVTTPQTGTLNAVTRQSIEGFNITDLAWGTAAATPVTLSFWVKSSLTGTFGGAIKNGANNRAYPFSYAIAVADTWEFKTVAITGDVTGTWATDNTAGLTVWFSHGTASTAAAGVWTTGDIRGVTGQVNLVSTPSATWQIAGAQLEEGSIATSFDFRDYGRELAMCQRYYCQGSVVSLHPQATTSFGASARNTLYIPPPRSTPVCTVTGNGSVTSLTVTPYLDTSGTCVLYFAGTATGSALISAWTASSEF
jgi:hypothetical protein